MDGNGISALTNYTMEEFLLRTKATLGAEPQASRIHGVLGGEAVDVACMASTLGYAYFLSQRDAGDCVCVPILNQRRSEARVPDETVAFLERQRVSWSALLWRDDMDLRQLHAEGKLSLTLLSTAVLNTLEDGALASCVVRVINCSEQQGGGEEASSTAMVAREILQEAPEQLTAPLAGLLRDALLVESAKTPSKDGHPPSDQEELLRALERVLHEDTPRSEVELRDFTGAGLDQVLLKDLKELSDGDIKVSISTVSLDLEAYSTCPSVIGDLKSFCDRHGYEGLVLVSSSLDDLYPQCHQVAVYSGNKDILNQICCELEESRSWSLDLEPLACLVDVVQLYQQRNTSIYVEQIVALVKEFLDRRQCLFIPNSRTSSTEGVAGSAPLSQGSSGITDMYSSDAEPPIAMENVPEASGPQQAFGELAAELVSPDSGLATVRSSRSSKESSVFLSDDSPVAETTGFLQNPALSFPSLCAAAAAAAGRATADRRPSARNKSDNFDLFSFDPLHSSSTSPAADGADEPSRSTEERASSSLSEFGELSLVDFYTGSSDGQVGSEGNFSPRLEQLLGDSMDARIPATPMNSLVEGSPLSSGLPKFFPEDVVEKINEMGNKESVSSSEPWDDFASDTKGSTSDDANVWSLTETGYIGEESPDIDLDKQAEVKDTGQTGKEGGGGADEDSFLLVSMDIDSDPCPSDTFFWATPVTKNTLDISDSSEIHQRPLQKLPKAEESPDDLWLACGSLNTVLGSNETSNEFPKPWGYFQERQDPIIETSNTVRLLDPFNVNESLKQPQDPKNMDTLPSLIDQECPPAIPPGSEHWEDQEEENSNRTASSGFEVLSKNDLGRGSVFHTQNMDVQAALGLECSAADESVLQTEQTQSVSGNTPLLQEAERTSWSMNASPVSVEEGCQLTKALKAEDIHALTTANDLSGAATTQNVTVSDTDRKRASHNCSDIETISSDILEMRKDPLKSKQTLIFPENDVSVSGNLASQNMKAIPLKEMCPSPDSTHMWNPFIQMTQLDETYDNWNPNLCVSDVWYPGTLGDIQLTPPEEETPFHPQGMGESLSIKMPVTTSRRTPLTPETSKEDSWQSKDGSSESDFWSYSARRGFLTATATPYPDSLDMWNTTIQEDSQSTLSTPDATDFSERSDSLRAPPRGQASLDSPLENLRGDMGMWNTTIREVSTDTSPEGKGQASSAESWAESLVNDAQDNSCGHISRAKPCSPVKESPLSSEEGPQEGNEESGEIHAEIQEVIGVDLEKQIRPNGAGPGGEGDVCDEVPLGEKRYSECLDVRPNPETQCFEHSDSGDAVVDWHSSSVMGFDPHLEKGSVLIEGYSHTQKDDIMTQNEHIKSQLSAEAATPISGSMVKSLSEYDNVDPGTLWYQPSPEFETWQKRDTGDVFTGVQELPVALESTASAPELDFHSAADVNKANIPESQGGDADSQGSWWPDPEPSETDHQGDREISCSELNVVSPLKGDKSIPVGQPEKMDIKQESNIQHTKSIPSAVPLTQGSGSGVEWKEDSITTIQISPHQVRGESKTFSFEDRGDEKGEELVVPGDTRLEPPDSVDDSSCHSPFVLLDGTLPQEGSTSPMTQVEDTLHCVLLSGDEFKQSLCELSDGARGKTSTSAGEESHDDWDDVSFQRNLEYRKSQTEEAMPHGLSTLQTEDTSLPKWFSHDADPICIVGPVPDTTKPPKAVVGSGSQEADCPDRVKDSLDLLQWGSQDDVRCNSDGDSSGLEMDYIMVSGRGVVREGGPGEISPLSDPAHSPDMCLPGPCQSNEDVFSLSVNINDSQTNMDVKVPYQTSPDVISLYQSNTERNSLFQSNMDLNSPYQMNIDVKSPDQKDIPKSSRQTNKDMNSPCESDIHVDSPYQSNTDSYTPYPTGVETSSLNQTSADLKNPWGSKAVARETFCHFKAKEEIYVRSQISLEDSDEEERAPPRPQSWTLLEKQMDQDGSASPGESSGVPDSSESDSGRSVREVGSPFASDLMGEVDGFFLHQASSLSDCLHLRRDHDGMIYGPGLKTQQAHTESLQRSEERVGGQLNLSQQEYLSEQLMGDQLLQGQQEHPAEQPMGDQLIQSQQECPAEQPMGDQLLQGHREYPSEQPSVDQHLQGQREQPAEQQMEDQLLQCHAEQAMGENRERAASEEPEASKDFGLADLSLGPRSQGSRTNKLVVETELDHTQYESERTALDDVAMDVPYEDGMMSPDGAESRPAPPSSLELHGAHPQRKKLSAPEINLSLDQSEGSILSDDALDTPDDLDINVDELDTPDEADSLEYTGHNTELEWEESQAASQEAPRECREAIPEYSAEEERQDTRLWRTVIIGEQEHRIDMRSIEPYQKVISHGGYYGDLNAIIVFAACFLPDSSRDDYHYVMENLFLYVISTLELMVAEDYMIVYLNGATPRRRMPGLGWLKKCYHMIDRRLRKNLKSFIIVHPSWFIRTILAVTRPFISSKFSSKIKYVNSLAELRELIPMEYVHIPDSIVKLDEELKEAAETAKYSSFLNGTEPKPPSPQIDQTVNGSSS